MKSEGREITLETRTKKHIGRKRKASRRLLLECFGKIQPFFFFFTPLNLNEMG